MKLIVRAFIEGTPIPQGSLRSGGRGQLFYSNASTLKPWRNKIAKTLAKKLPAGHVPVPHVPIMVRASFLMPRGKTVTRALPTTPADLDKLTRALGDALTNSGIFVDDAQVVEWRSRKVYAEADESPGVAVEVYEVDEE